MASKKNTQASTGQPKVNKAKRIRELMKDKPDMKATEVVELLKSEGIDVNPNYVATVVYHQKGGSKKTNKNAEPSIEELKSFSKIATQYGGTPKIREHLKVTQEIVSQAGGDIDRAVKVLDALDELLPAVQAAGSSQSAKPAA